MEESIGFRTHGKEHSGFLSLTSSTQTVPFSNFGLFLLRPLSGSSGEKQQLICLRSDRIYNIGRKRRLCQIVFDHCCISRRHCQIFLDGSERRLRLVDGFYLSRFSDILRFGRRLQSDCQGLGLTVSLNGVFINRRKLQRGSVADLSEGDEVVFACGNFSSGPRCLTRYGFVVERIILSEPNKTLDVCRQSVTTANALQNLCKNVLRSRDPISYLRCSLPFGVEKRNSVHGVSDYSSNASFTVLGSVSCSTPTAKAASNIQSVTDGNNIAADAAANAETAAANAETAAANAETAPASSISIKNTVKSNKLPHEGGVSFDSFSNGQKFFLNRLQFMAHGDTSYQPNEVTLMELLHPVESLAQIFIATFTCDISWFLSCCQIPTNLPVTVACHSTEKCWSSRCFNRTLAPYSDYPNLLLIYPPFPDEIAFGCDRSKKGVACHHPKLFVLQRDESIRVVVTSANLASKQWNQITNTVWWQDFPRRDAPDYSSLFAPIRDLKSDFSAQLAGFIASLITDVPSQSHWIKELTKYDFGGAAVHLIASVPGMHAPISNHSGIDFFQSLEKVVLPVRTTTILGSVQASVVGLSHRFHTATDSRGEQLKKLSSLLGKYQESSSELMQVVLQRNYNIPADDNAISVIVSSFQDLSIGEFVQLGFLPRDVAKWAAPLGDHGFLEVSAFIYPKEALAAALNGNNTKVQCLLSIAQGPKFSEISRLIQPEDFPALCSFIASVQRCLGLWRLQEVMSQYKWPDLLETDFLYASSSIGTSMNSEFLAAFSAAAGKKSFQLFDSDESDPGWGCWNTDHELRSPSIKILFPTIDRVKSSTHGIQLSKCLLSFSESTWQRLGTTGIFHDAIPNSTHRIGYPMHVKVARRRFQSKNGPAFGWIYCGSHNFSPAAWGRVVQIPSASGRRGSATRLRICNYELGVILIIPPPGRTKGPVGSLGNLDHISLPFSMPAPRYSVSDRPATARAMREAMAENAIEQVIVEMDADGDDIEDDEIPEPSDYIVAEEREDDKIYAEMLWSQVDLSDCF